MKVSILVISLFHLLKFFYPPFGRLSMLQVNQLDSMHLLKSPLFGANSKTMRVLIQLKPFLIWKSKIAVNLEILKVQFIEGKGLLYILIVQG